MSGANSSGRAPTRNATVATLAGYAAHATCPTAAVAFSAGIDTDRLLEGTACASPFGQPPFAFSRGTSFEARVKEDRGEGNCRYGPLLALLREHLGFEAADVNTPNLRLLYPSGRQRAARARHTRNLLRDIARGVPGAPNFIDGALLRAEVSGRESYYEADGLAFRLGGRIHVIEIKSFPIVDDQADSEKLGAALDQGALYILLVQRELVAMGFPADLVSDALVLICPRNVGMAPMLRTHRVGQRIKRIEALLARLPALEDLVDEDVAGDLDWNAVAPAAGRDVEQRLAALAQICDRVGTTFSQACQGCGLYRFCRERTYAYGAVALSGEGVSRELAGIETLPRALALSRGARATPVEAPAAEELARLRTLQDQALQRVAR